MSTPVTRLYNTTVYQFGNDNTGLVEYTFNSQGFRSSQDYVIVPNYAFFGCSLVFGIGVPIDQVFTSYFTHSHNYGIAGNYNNNDIFQSIQDFINSELYSCDTKLIIVWTDRNTEWIDNYYQQLKSYNVIHFFCGKVLSYQNCYAMIPQLDTDISGTHMGAKTHRTFWKVLSNLCNQ
jgi:hypothetical protein